MLAIIAAVLFGLALLFQITGTGVGTLLTTSTMLYAGLLFVALHLAGVGTTLRGRGFARRRR